MKARDISAILQRIPTLPDEAVVVDPVAAILCGVHVRTLRRHNPVPEIRLTERIIGRRLGDIRALGRSAQPA